jgi:hypothetical protein
VVVTVVLLLAAVVLLIAALGTGHAGLAWGSVVLSAVAATLILTRWRRSWVRRRDAADDELIVLLEDEPVDAEPGEQPGHSGSMTGVQAVEPGSASAEGAQVEDVQTGDAPIRAAQSRAAEPGEEDTDAADLLVVYELIDEVLVVDEHPRYHLPRCRWPDQAHTERLPVREARELGFTPCERCRPDTTLARKHRAARATTTGMS